MKISSTQKRYAEIQAELDRLRAEIGRCNAAVAAASAANDVIADIRRKRAEEVATAFIYKREPSLDDIDASLVAAEAAGRQAQIDGEAAKVALEVIDTRCAELDAEQDEVRTHVTAQMLDELAKRYEEAKKRFADAAADIGAAMVDLSAIGTLQNRLRGRHGSLHQADFLYGKLDTEGLRVIRESDGNLVQPAWMHRFRPDSTERSKQILDEIDRVGITS